MPENNGTQKNQSHWKPLLINIFDTTLEQTQFWNLSAKKPFPSGHSFKPPPSSKQNSLVSLLWTPTLCDPRPQQCLPQQVWRSNWNSAPPGQRQEWSQTVQVFTERSTVLLGNAAVWTSVTPSTVHTCSFPFGFRTPYLQTSLCRLPPAMRGYAGSLVFSGISCLPKATADFSFPFHSSSLFRFSGEQLIWNKNVKLSESSKTSV